MPGFRMVIVLKCLPESGGGGTCRLLLCPSSSSPTPVTLTNSHNQRANRPTNKHDGSQYLLTEVIIIAKNGRKNSNGVKLHALTETEVAVFHWSTEERLVLRTWIRTECPGDVPRRFLLLWIAIQRLVEQGDGDWTSERPRQQRVVWTLQDSEEH